MNILKRVYKNMITYRLLMAVGFTCFHLIAKAQNLIPNPSFENTNDVTNAQVYLSETSFPGIHSWLNPTHHNYAVKQVGRITSDTLEAIRGNINLYRPYHGSANATIGMSWVPWSPYCHKYFIQCKLLDTLQLGCTYRFSLYILPTAIHLSDQNPQTSLGLSAYFVSTKAMGFYFSQHRPLDTVSAIGYSFDSVNIQPQVMLPQTHFITDTTNYTRVSGSFVAQGGEQYLTIGFFGPVISNDSTYIFRNGQTSVMTSGYMGGMSAVRFHIDSLNLHRVKPSPTLLTTSNDTAICPGDSLQLYSQARGAQSLQWDDNSTDSLRTITGPGTYWVNAYYNCGDVLSDTIVVTLKDTLPPIVLKDTTMCAGETAHYKVPAGPTYLLDGSPVNTSFDITTAGHYTLTASVECQTKTFGFEVSHYEAAEIPELNILDTTLCEGETWQISLPDSLNYTLNNQATKSHITISKRISYELQADNGCESQTFYFTVNDEGCETLLFVPNAFTPDGDGINDCFDVSVIEQQSYHIVIFNRWGQQVYESTNPDACWDGTYDGKLQGGVYTYLITVGTPGREIKERGYVNVVR